MTEPMFKYVNAIDPRTGKALRVRKTGRPISHLVRLTEQEVEAFEAERAARHQEPMQEDEDQ